MRKTLNIYLVEPTNYSIVILKISMLEQQQQK